MTQTSNLKNTLLLVAPVVVLGGLGILLKNREPAVFTVPAPSRLYIKKVRLVPIKPSEVQQGYDTKVEVELGATGRATSWWEKGPGIYYSAKGGQVVVNSQVSSVSGSAPWNIGPHLEKRTRALCAG